MIDREGSSKPAPAADRAQVDFVRAEISTGMALAKAASAECSGDREYAAKLLSKAKRAYDHASRGLIEMHTTITDAASLTQNLKALRSMLEEVAKLVESRGLLRFGFRQPHRS